MHNQRQNLAKKFVEKWQEGGREINDCQSFWIDLLQMVLGVDDATSVITFEKSVTSRDGTTKRIDGYIEKTHVLIEQKSSGVSLDESYHPKTKDGLNAHEQAVRYNNMLPYNEKARWIVTCNFREFRVYDMDRPNDTPETLLLKNIEAEQYRLRFLVDTSDSHVKEELAVSIRAGEIVGLLYDELIKQYRKPESAETLRSLNILCVRLVFCLYAEDAGIFGTKTMFHDYLAEFTTQHTRRALSDLFRILDTKPEERDPYLASDNPKLAEFPYVNGGLFSDRTAEIPPFNEKLKQLLLKHASADFDWSSISPTIFGAIFESTLNPETRRTGGMHYTSVDNIHKVIGPLFLDDLRHELEQALLTGVAKERHRRLIDLQNRMAKLCFLDPACGSGNFLTETYLSLRRIENDILRELYGGLRQMGYTEEGDSVVKVSISRFFGIEINDFAVTVAKTALWIAESRMLRETENIVGINIDFLPLRTNAGIVEGNALRTDWATLEGTSDVLCGPLYKTACSTEAHHYDYIIGNPPFVGGMLMSREQHTELANAAPECKNVGEADYVVGWYYKAADFIKGTDTHCAFVSTNSISQGQAVANVWKPLFNKGLHIDFAYRTFKWQSESTDMAAVHCVIVGFSMANKSKPKVIYEGDKATEAANINGYLMDAPSVFIDSRSVPLCAGIPKMRFGSMPRDGGGFILTAEEKTELLKREPLAAKWVHLYLGAEEYINSKERYCLWLLDATPKELRSCPKVMERVKHVQDFRAKSKAEATRKWADRPTLFCQNAQPATDYIIVPSVSSERRRYVPMGFLTPDVICSNLVLIIPSATLYHFGVLTSSVHMAWMRAVAGRLKSDYRYSKDIVYNNFVWPEASAEQQERITQTAQAILDARAMFPDSSLADLYDELTMPPALRKAHTDNDRAVLAAYGWSADTPEADIVSQLMQRYSALKKRYSALMKR